jgi:hypothetical protein
MDSRSFSKCMLTRLGPLCLPQLSTTNKFLLFGDIRFLSSLLYLIDVTARRRWFLSAVLTTTLYVGCAIFASDEDNGTEGCYLGKKVSLSIKLGWALYIVICVYTRVLMAAKAWCLSFLLCTWHLHANMATHTIYSHSWQGRHMATTMAELFSGLRQNIRYPSFTQK